MCPRCKTITILVIEYLVDKQLLVYRIDKELSQPGEIIF